MSYYTSSDKEVATLIERFDLDDLTIFTDGDEPRIYMHCGRDLALSEYRAIADAAMDLWTRDACAREEM